MHSKLRLLIVGGLLAFSGLLAVSYSLATDSLTDVVSPVISNVQPTGTIPYSPYGVTISFSTDENATCRYHILSFISFGGMFSFGDPNTTSHSKTFIGWTPENFPYKLYVKCIDAAGNVNTDDYPMSFLVGAGSCLESGQHGTSTPGMICCDSSSKLKVNYSFESGSELWYNCCSVSQCAMDGVCWDSGFKIPDTNSICINGEWEYDTGDASAPVISGGQPTGKVAYSANGVIISASTNENAVCRYSTEANTAFSNMTGTFTTSNTTSHRQVITNLVGGRTYNYYIRCQDSSGNVNTSDYKISFSIYTPSAITCSSFTYTPWSACNSNGVQSRNILTSLPNSCTGGKPVLFQKCTPTCNLFAYTPWSACQSNSLQYRWVASTTPTTCTGGSPVLTQECTYIPNSSDPTTSTNSTASANLCVITPAGGNYFSPVDITVTCGSNVTSSSWRWGKNGSPVVFTTNTAITYSADQPKTLYVTYSYRVGTRTKTGTSYRTFTANQSYCKVTPDAGTYAVDTNITINCGSNVKRGTYQWDNGAITSFASSTSLTYVANRNKKLKITFTYDYQRGTKTLEKTAVFNKSYSLKRCTDTEVGYVSQLKGNTAFSQNTTTKNYTDTCSGAYLVEYYCGVGHSVKSTKIKCPYGCSNGACLLPNSGVSN